MAYFRATCIKYMSSNMCQYDYQSFCIYHYAEKTLEVGNDY